MATRDASPNRLLEVLRTRRMASASELGAALGASQPTVSRWLAGAADHIVKIGRARSSRYAATRRVHGLGDRWPLYCIDSAGQPHEFGQLIALQGNGCLVATKQSPDWLRGEFSAGVFPGLPWFLDDMRPQGFLGRLFAERCAHELGLNPDILRWDENAVLTAMLLRGEDGPGHFVLGEKALDRALRTVPETIPLSARGARYAALASATLAGERVGSSAAGKQPKFTACVADADDSLRHVIVKFTEPVAGNPVGRRWADLLICESMASQVLSEHGCASAHNELVWSEGRLCLESTRFDRVSAHGRRGFVSLAAWSDAHDGLRDHWPDAVERMQHAGWLTAAAVDQIRQLWWFGRLIGNSDMHFGNFGFFLDDARPLQPCPSYDMLPMMYRPAGNGSVAPRAYQPPPPLPAARTHWQNAARWATELWQRVRENAEVSDDFRRIADDNHAELIRLRQRFD